MKHKPGTMPHLLVPDTVLRKRLRVIGRPIAIGAQITVPGWRG